jgi:hypothetical protein
MVRDGVRALVRRIFEAARETALMPPQAAKRARENLVWGCGRLRRRDRGRRRRPRSLGASIGDGLVQPTHTSGLGLGTTTTYIFLGCIVVLVTYRR